MVPKSLSAAGLLLPLVSAACQKAVITSMEPPSVAPGYNVNLIADGFGDPRGIIFDSEGHLLVVDSGTGIYHQHLSDSGGSCVAGGEKTLLVDDSSLNHGIELSEDGKTLYASNVDVVYSYPYDPVSATVMTSQRKTIIGGMDGTDHVTRTLLMSKKMPGMLLVGRGSVENIDPLAAEKSSGHSQLKVFNLNNITKTYSYNKDGMLLGWGLRNDVGIAEEPVTGGLYTVENSVDMMSRLGEDIHEDNPAEELNFFGTLIDNKSSNQGANFGYPECYSAWDVHTIPERRGLEVGMQFAIGSENIEKQDTVCRQDRVAPRLVFEAHMAPLDIKFDTRGTTAWVTFHGSWNRAEPSGYKVSLIHFANGEPVAPSTSLNGYVDIVTNADASNCPNNCFRPVGLAWDPNGRLYFSSDATGQLFIITKDGNENGAVDPAAAGTKSLPSGGSDHSKGAAPSISSASSYLTAIVVAGLAGIAFLM